MEKEEKKEKKKKSKNVQNFEKGFFCGLGYGLSIVTVLLLGTAAAKKLGLFDSQETTYKEWSNGKVYQKTYKKI